MSVSQLQRATWLDLPWSESTPKRTPIGSTLDNLAPKINVSTLRADGLIRAIEENPALATATTAVTSDAVIGKRVIDELLALVGVEFWAPDGIIYLPNNYRNSVNNGLQSGYPFHQDVVSSVEDPTKQIFVAVGTNGVPPIMTEFRKRGTQVVHASRKIPALQAKVGTGGLFRIDFKNGQTIRYTRPYKRSQTEAIAGIPSTVTDPRRAIVVNIRYASYALWESPEVTAQNQLDRVATTLLDLSSWNGKAYGFEYDFDDELALETTASRAQDAVRAISSATYSTSGNPFGIKAANRLVFASLALKRSVKDPDLQAQAVLTWTDTTRNQLVKSIQETLDGIQNVPPMPTIGWDTLKTVINRLQYSTVLTKETVAAEIASRRAFPLNRYTQAALDAYITDHSITPNMIPALTRAIVEFNLVRDPTFAYPNMAEFYAIPPTAAILATTTNPRYKDKPADMFRLFVNAIEPQLVHGFSITQHPTASRLVVDVNAQFTDLVDPPQDDFNKRPLRATFIDLTSLVSPR